MNSLDLRPLPRESTSSLASVDSASTSHRRATMSNNTTTPPLTVGSYVMAKWRNKFEYLAEVLAHRQRHEYPWEYRVRYVWDNVTEWISLSRLRKATQYEIDYVLRFCHSHGGPGAGKATSVVKGRKERPLSRKNATAVASAATSLPNLTTRSRSTPQSTADDTDGKASGKLSRPTTSSASRLSIAKPNQSSGSVCGSPYQSSAGSVEQDGMLYDRAVMEFHEACRKRRELKRKAIEAELDNPPKEEIKEKVCDGSGVGGDGSLISMSAKSQTYNTRRPPNKMPRLQNLLHSRDFDPTEEPVRENEEKESVSVSFYQLDRL